MMRNTSHSSRFQEYLWKNSNLNYGRSFGGLSPVTSEYTHMEDRSFEDFGGDIMEYTPVDEQYLENHPNLIIDSLSMIDVLCPRNVTDSTVRPQEKSGNRTKKKTKEKKKPITDRRSDDDTIPSLQQTVRIPSVEISPPPDGKNVNRSKNMEVKCDDEVNASSLRLNILKTNISPTPSEEEEDDDPVEMMEEKTTPAATSPTVILLPPPSPNILSPRPPPQKAQQHEKNSTELKDFLLIGFRPARRKDTGYTDIRHAICELVCTAPYKYSFIIIVARSHPNFSTVCLDDFQIVLEGEKIPGMKSRRFIVDDDDDDDIDNKKKKRRKRKRKKKSSSSQRNNNNNINNERYFQIENGVKIEFLKEEVSQDEKRIVCLLQFLKTSFHYCCKFRMVVRTTTTTTTDVSGNNLNVSSPLYNLEIAKTDFFTAVARKKKVISFRFWEKYKVFDDSLESLISVAKSPFLENNYNAKKKSNKKKMKKNNNKNNNKKNKNKKKNGSVDNNNSNNKTKTGKKRKREDEEDSFVLDKSGNHSNVSMSNIITGRRMRKKRKLM